MEVRRPATPSRKVSCVGAPHEDRCHSRGVDERELASRIDALPAGLKVWFDGPAALPRLLTVNNVRRYAELVGKAEEMGVELLPGYIREELQQRWRHAVSSLVEWHSEHGHTDPGPVPVPRHAESPMRSARGHGPVRVRSRQLGKQDYVSAIDLSRAWFALNPIRVGLATGVMGVSRVKGKHIWVTNKRRADIEVLDTMLAQVTMFDSPTPDPESHLVDESLVANARIGATGGLLNEIPPHILDIAWREAEALLDIQGLSLPASTDLGGLTLAQARTCYAYLITQLRLNEFAAFNLNSPETLLWGIRPANLQSVLSRRVGGPAASAFIDLAKYQKGRSPVSAPLIPHRDMLLIPAELVSPIAFERTLLRAASADPNSAGQLGNALGHRASRWAERLRSVPGCLVGEELPVKGADGHRLGDLDLVAWDPVRRVMLIVETKWPVDAATLAEGFKVDAMIDKGRAQIARLRTSMEDGSGTATWPRDWNVPPDTRTSWWVGTAQQLDSRGILDGNGVGATSLRLVEHLLPAENLDDLLTRLSAFPLPRYGVEYRFESSTVQAGDLTIHFKALALLGDPPAPPADRRTQNGWT